PDHRGPRAATVVTEGVKFHWPCREKIKLGDDQQGREGSDCNNEPVPPDGVLSNPIAIELADQPDDGNAGEDRGDLVAIGRNQGFDSQVGAADGGEKPGAETKPSQR